MPRQSEMGKVFICTFDRVFFSADIKYLEKRAVVTRGDPYNTGSDEKEGSESVGIYNGSRSEKPKSNGSEPIRIRNTVKWQGLKFSTLGGGGIFFDILEYASLFCFLFINWKTYDPIVWVPRYLLISKGSHWKQRRTTFQPWQFPASWRSLVVGRWYRLP